MKCDYCGGKGGVTIDNEWYECPTCKGKGELSYKFKTTPYEHQNQAYDKLYDKEYSALFMEQGTGKSKVAIDMACNRYMEKKITAVLLIAPNGVHTQWADEQIPTHSSVKTKIFKWSSKKSKIWLRLLEKFILEPCEGLKWFCINVDAFSSKNHLSTFREYVANNNTYVIIAA